MTHPIIGGVPYCYPEIKAVTIRASAFFKQENIFTNEIIGTIQISYDLMHQILYIIIKILGITQFIMTPIPETNLLGDKLGEKHYIKAFESLSPKLYAYKLDDGTTTLKLNKINLNFYRN